MSDTATQPSFIRVTGEDVSPACFKPDWIPDLDVFPDLTHLHDEHVRLKAAWTAAGATRQDIKDRIEADTERRATALRDAYLAGDANPKQEDPNPKLKAELEQAQRHCEGAAHAFLELINRCIATIIEKQPEWTGALEAREAGIEQEIEDLLQQVSDARSKRGSFKRLTYWLHRTAVDGAELPMLHHNYGAINYPPPETLAAEAELDHKNLLASYAGDSTLITDEESVRLEQEALGLPSTDAVLEPEPVTEVAA